MCIKYNTADIVYMFIMFCDFADFRYIFCHVWIRNSYFLIAWMSVMIILIQLMKLLLCDEVTNKPLISFE